MTLTRILTLVHRRTIVHQSGDAVRRVIGGFRPQNVQSAGSDGPHILPLGPSLQRHFSHIFTVKLS